MWYDWYGMIWYDELCDGVVLCVVLCRVALCVVCMGGFVLERVCVDTHKQASEGVSMWMCALPGCAAFVALRARARACVRASQIAVQRSIMPQHLDRSFERARRNEPRVWRPCEARHLYNVHACSMHSACMQHACKTLDWARRTNLLVQFIFHIAIKPSSDPDATACPSGDHVIV